MKLAYNSVYSHDDKSHVGNYYMRKTALENETLLYCLLFIAFTN